MKRAAATAVVALVPALGLAQAPAGSEFEVHNVFSGDVRVAEGGNGTFVVAWEQYPGDGSLMGVLARRFAADGAPQGGAFVVNTFTTGNQRRPALAADARGNFVLAWDSDTFLPYVAHRHFDVQGRPRGSETRAPMVNLQFNSDAAVALDAHGRMTAAWRAVAEPPWDGIFAVQADRAGTPRGDPFKVNTTTTGQLDEPAVASAPDGAFMVAWQRTVAANGSYTVLARSFDASGAPRGDEFPLSAATTAKQFGPSVASDGDGRFTVVWTSYLAGDSDILAQRFSPGGVRLGAEFRVNAYTTGFQVQPTIAADENGTFVVAWTDSRRDGSLSGVFARRFDASGTPRGGDFQVNTQTFGYQAYPSVGSDGSGNFVVTWGTTPPLRPGAPDGGEQGVRGQRYGGLFAHALSTDPAGNGVWEPGEEVEVQPAWRNATGAAQTVGGTLGPLTGPAGATYSITDATAAYGTLADGGTAACTDCYRVAVSAPAARPAPHWDAVATETLAPAAQGQVKRWRLHLGGSYADVPAASPLYRFVEILLHRGVAAGCAAGQYCPGSSTTRGQVAVFALAAKEGETFAPPACADPMMFGDVPVADPLCPWIEELARRGITGGCGGGNYCPADPVTRGQMAVFMLRTLDPALSPPSCGTPLFADVPASSPLCRWIEELARRGVTGGCGGGNYCPADPVTRGQMAVFTAATFGLTLYGP